MLPIFQRNGIGFASKILHPHRSNISSTFHTNRNFYQWLNIIFNRVDIERKQKLGPDRVCAEWLLRNGGSVQWKGCMDFLNNYNSLPSENTKCIIQQVDASESSISHYGFMHFQGCESIEKLILHKCSYLQDEALCQLKFLKNSLVHLQISSCYDITDSGIMCLRELSNLKILTMEDLPLVKNPKTISSLQESCPKCTITFK